MRTPEKGEDFGAEYGQHAGPSPTGERLSAILNAQGSGGYR